MRIYEKPMAIINKFEVEDIIAASKASWTASEREFSNVIQSDDTAAQAVNQGVIFQW